MDDEPQANLDSRGLRQTQMTVLSPGTMVAVRTRCSNCIKHILANYSKNLQIVIAEELAHNQRHF